MGLVGTEEPCHALHRGSHERLGGGMKMTCFGPALAFVVATIVASPASAFVSQSSTAVVAQRGVAPAASRQALPGVSARGSRGCGSRGGPGYRLPNGKCASRRG